MAEVKCSMEAPRVPIHAVRLQPLSVDRTPAETLQFCPARVVAERSVAGSGGDSWSYRSTASTRSSEKKDDAEQLEEGRTAEVVVSKAEVDACRNLWKRNRKMFWAQVGANLSPELATTLRQVTDVCTKSTKRGEECDLNLCNSRLGDEGTHVLGIVLGMGDMYVVRSTALIAASYSSRAFITDLPYSRQPG
eukprot:COSAG02_NODE_133_length_34692_cov_83.845229_11_plen_192_part_00